MAKLGINPLAKQRHWQSSLVLLCCLLFLSTFALSLTLYSARQAHAKLLGGLKDRESKINQLHQKMAEVKVESVEMQSRAEDAENQRSRVQDMLDRVSKDLDEKNKELVKTSNTLSQANAQLSDLEGANAELKQRLEESNKRLAAALEAEQTLKSRIATIEGQNELGTGGDMKT